MTAGFETAIVLESENKLTNLQVSTTKDIFPPDLARVNIGMAITLAFSYGLQMYVPVPAFHSIGSTFSLSLSQLSLLVASFFVGYAVAHIPAGFAVAAYGYKRVAITGSALFAISTALFAVSNHFGLLLASRLLGGIAMSITLAAVIPLAAGWARPNKVRIIVGGYVNGFGFTAGAAIGLYAWTYLTEALGWRVAVGIAAVFGLAVTALAAVLVTNPSHVDHEEFSWSSTVRCLRMKPLWTIGIAAVGIYGLMATASQLAPEYAVSNLELSVTSAGLLSAIMLAAGIPGALIGGFFADRARRYLLTVAVPAAIAVACMAVAPFAGPVLFGALLTVIGFMTMAAFAPVTAVPSEYPGEISPRDYGTAMGLVLTLGNVGAILLPYIYGTAAEQFNTTAGWLTLAIVAGVSCCALLITQEPRTDRPESV
uniref:MFS transporter n=1 Tax=Rhodococcus qingshengii TaxID=334542 RepID=UPI001C4E1415|nr:MFS transporter [Rhodococcus qingshengii]